MYFFIYFYSSIFLVPSMYLKMALYTLKWKWCFENDIVYFFYKLWSSKVRAKDRKSEEKWEKKEKLQSKNKVESGLFEQL